MPTHSNKQSFNAESTTHEVIAGVNLEGRTALVTGVTSGLGLETAKTLAGAGAEVILVARDQHKLHSVVDLIQAEYPAAQLNSAVLDLADLGSVKRCADELLAKYSKLDLLINNAGIMACPYELTALGYESQFATNHLGHFLITGLLLPLLAGAGAARVINLSSAGHKYAAIDFDDIHFEQRAYDKWLAYGQSKTANALFSVALTQRFKDKGIVANAVHPGAIVTELGRHLSRDDIKAMMSQDQKKTTLRYKSIPQGAATTVWAATSTELAATGGVYLEDCQIGLPANDLDSSKGYLAYALDPLLADALWQVSEHMVGQSFSA